MLVYDITDEDSFKKVTPASYIFRLSCALGADLGERAEEDAWV